MIQKNKNIKSGLLLFTDNTIMYPENPGPVKIQREIKKKMDNYSFFQKNKFVKMAKNILKKRSIKFLCTTGN